MEESQLFSRRGTGRNVPSMSGATNLGCSWSCERTTLISVATYLAAPLQMTKKIRG